MGLRVMGRPSNASYPSNENSNSGNSHNEFKKEIEDAIRKVFNEQRQLPNPDPKNYRIVAKAVVGDFLILKIVYPDCTNFEGQKILVYKGTTLEKLEKQKYIDPHFCDDLRYISPVARFVPTAEGWNLAYEFCRILNDQSNSHVRKKGPQTAIEGKRVYTNGLMLAPDGEMLCRIGQSKIDWYLKRGLAEYVTDSPPTIKLKFEPKGRGHRGDEFYLQEKEDKCVACGSAERLSKHHVVPQCFRRFFPEKLKNHSYHDILLLCRDCHDKYERFADELKKDLSKEYNVSLQGKGRIIDTGVKRVTGAASALLYHRDQLSKKRRRQLESVIKNYFQKKKLEQRDIEIAAKLSHDIKTEDFIEYGRYVVNNIPSMQDFVIRWRKHFVETMKPSYMPDYWDINRQVENK